MRRITEKDLKAMYQPMPESMQADLRQTLASLPEKKEKIIMKKKMSIGLAVVLLILFGMLSAALAAGFFTERVINWKGEVMEEQVELLPGLTPKPEEVPDYAEMEAMDETARRLAHNVDPHEIRIGYWLDAEGRIAGQVSEQRTQKFESYDALLDALKSAPYLTLPGEIPENYHFDEGEVFLLCAADTEYHLTETIKDPSGVMVDCYRVNPEDDVIVGYSVTFRESEEDYHYLYIHSDLANNLDENEFMIGLQENEEAEAVALPAAENALLLTGPNRMELMARKKLSENISIRDMMELFHPDEGERIIAYNEEIIMAFAPLLTRDEVLALYPVP